MHNASIAVSMQELLAAMKTLNDLLAHKWLGAMCRNVDKDSHGDQERQDATANPKWPAR